MYCILPYGSVWRRGGIDEDTARWLYQQLILAVDYCHKVHISSRDIKLENALLDSAEPGRRPLLKLCDFSYSINEDASEARTRVGTPGYTGTGSISSRAVELLVCYPCRTSKLEVKNPSSDSNCHKSSWRQLQIATASVAA